MKAYRLYAAVGAADEELLARCEEVKTAAAPVRWKKTVLAAACLCLVVFGTVMGFRFFTVFDSGDAVSGFVFGSDGDDGKSSAVAGKYVPPGEIVKSYEAVGKNGDSIGTSSCYAAPEPGEWIIGHAVSEALKLHTGEDVLYFVGIDISYGDRGPEAEHRVMEPEGPEMNAELKRLTELGYLVGYAESWTYRGEGERVYYNYAAGYLTKEQLIDFQANEQYGYFFQFNTNGNSEPVDAQDGIVTDFDYGEGIDVS